jgi:4-hydroxymandelate oxidase
MARVDTRACASCHGGSGPAADGRTVGIKPMFTGIDMKDVTLTSATLRWDFVKRVKDVTTMKVLIKGLESGDDAALAVTSGADGIIVSNHGGRATETGRPTIDALPEVVQGAGGRIPVLLDGGVRRGTDVFKAIALGAAAVGIGRPYIWGLSSFGPGRRRARAADSRHRAAARDGRVRHHDAEGHHHQNAHRQPCEDVARAVSSGTAAAGIQTADGSTAS